MAELTGQIFAGFEVVAKLGQGGMGAVYKARQPLLDRFVALKVMSPQLSGDPAYVARFIREAASAAKLNHPNMVQVHTAGEQNGIYYIVMEFVEGESLAKRLKRVGCLDAAEAIAITLHVATALQCAWNKAQLIHRDIKPDNIFLSKDGEVKVGDLGLAKSVSGGATEMTQSGMMMGSPHYMSPEQARALKETDFKTDIYSLGCTLYQLLTGTTPYQADEALALILKHVNDPAPDIQAVIPNCPQALAALVTKMMAKDRNQRHASYEALIAELWQVSDIIGQLQSAGTAAMTPAAASAGVAISPTVKKVGTVVPTVKQTVTAIAPQSKTPDRKLVYAAAGIAVVGVLAGVLLWAPWKPSPSSGPISDLRSPNSQLPTPPLPLGSVFTNSVGAEMVYIPPGEFMLGSTKEEHAWALANIEYAASINDEGDQPRKTVIKQGFWMGRTEVTMGQWEQFVAATGYVTDGEKKGESEVPPGLPFALMKGKSWRDPNFEFEPQDNHPVCCVSWNDAKAFCKWLDGREHTTGRLPQGYVARLPTEAEWEYACRAGTQTKFWWGDSEEDGKGRLNWAGKEDGFQFVAPVDSFGSRGRNQFGLADMLGNVYEWCLESYKDPPNKQVVRGGSFNYRPALCRSAVRLVINHSHSNSMYGFRVVYGVDVTGGSKAASVPPPSALKEGGILAPPETRVAALTTNPKVGEVYTLPLGSNVMMELMGIPAGEFMMGSTKEEQAWAVANGRKEKEVKCEGEAPRKAIIKQAFWMGRTTVTVVQWKQFVKETGYLTDGEKKGESQVKGPADKPDKPWVPKKGTSWRNPDFGFEMRDDHPVSCISWNDAKAFCEWLNGKEQRAGRLAHGYAVRLPTEAEWEYACRAGTQSKFWWGESKDDGRGRLNWAREDDGFELVAPVDSFGERGRNRFGLADMIGNVWQWCLDEYDATQAHENLWIGSPDKRALRGGSWHTDPANCRCAYRQGPPLDYSHCVNGFRIVVGLREATATSQELPARQPVQGQAGILAPPEIHGVPASDWINLIPGIDHKRNGISGGWKVENGKLLCTTRAPWALCEVPVNYKGGNYDLRFRVIRGEGSDIGVFFLFRKGNTGGVASFDVTNPTRRAKGLETKIACLTHVEDKAVTNAKNEAQKERPSWIPKGNEKTVLIQVRDEGVVVNLDGEEVLRWEGNWKDVTQIGPFLAMTSHNNITRPIFGVCLFNCEAVFSAIEMREFTGKDISMRASKEAGILAPPETRVAALTTNPKVGEVYTLALGSNVTMELMGIPPGEFMLGSTKEEQAWAVANGQREEETKCEGAAPRKARIKQGFWMGRTEVTVSQWKQFVKETDYVTDGEKSGGSAVTHRFGKKWEVIRGKSWRDPSFGFDLQDNHPVCCISWNDAKAFCEWLTEREQKAERLAAGQMVRLPTEAEWEYACRGGTQTKFWWGDSKEDGKGRLNWHETDDGFEFISPVNRFGARGQNRFGLADMLGNVWEWCLDRYDATQAHEDLWTGYSNDRVMRGVSFDLLASNCRCATRRSFNESKSASCHGFRVVVGVELVGGSRTAIAPTLPK